MTAVRQMKYAIEKSYGKKGQKIVEMNYAAVDRGGEYVKVDVPAEWANIVDENLLGNDNFPAFVKDIVVPVTVSKAMIYRYLHSKVAKTEPGIREPQNTRNVVLLYCACLGNG